MAERDQVHVTQEPPETSKSIQDEVKGIFKRMGLQPADRPNQPSKTIVLFSPQGRLYAEVDNLKKYYPKNTSDTLVVAVLETDDGSYYTDNSPVIKNRPEIRDSVYLYVRNNQIERRYAGLLYTWKNTKSLCRVYDAFHRHENQTWLSPFRKWDASLGIPRSYSGTFMLPLCCLGLFMFGRRGFGKL